MPEKTPQTYANHTRLDPAYHFVLVPVAVITVGLTIWNAIQNCNFRNAWLVVASLAGVVAVLKIRTYALKAQDRVIRLEERLRLANLLPEAQRSRIGELTERQLIALRFASDAEIPGLVEKAVAGTLGGKEIKKSIRSWRPDYFRV